MSSVIFTIRRLTIDAVTWTPVVTPFPCRRIAIEQGDGVNDLKIRSDAADANTEKTIAAGTLQPLTSEFLGDTVGGPGETVCYLQAAAGTGPAVLEFVR